jgi:Predicted membrane protein (DUF2232)
LEQLKNKLTTPAVIAVLGFGLLGFLQIFIIPLSIPAITGLVILLTDRRLMIGLGAALGCLILSFLTGGSFLAIETAFIVLLPAAIIAICIRLNKQSVSTVFITVLPVLILILFFYLSYGDSTSYYDEIAPVLEEDFDELSEILSVKEKLGVSEVEYEGFKDSYLSTIRLMIRFMPALILTSVTIIAALAYILIGYCFKREGRYLLTFPSLRGWKIDERVMIVFGIAMLTVIIGNGMIANIGENIALYLFIMFSFGGLSLLEFHMQKRKFGRLFKFLVYFSLIIFNYYAAIVVGFLGLIDSHFDFRRLRAVKIG